LPSWFPFFSRFVAGVIFVQRHFVLLTSLAWLAVCYFFMLSLGVGASNASATAVQMLLPGVTLALAFWVLGVAHSGA
jgi:hypothetical protein